ncbi:MAG: single-stranded-DNA-specific exonuclease RecJ [Anaerolineales bacterium]|jgi:single-stranded-DNA-specific exonuclease
MNEIKKQWLIAPRIPPSVEEELENFSPILRQILYNRGYANEGNARKYLQSIPPFETNPFTLVGMSEAVERIKSALDRRETIVIYGDYDVDGITATALMVQFLRRLGITVNAYIPNRFDEGYGLNIEALEQLHSQGLKLVVTVDCGIRSLEEAEFAKNIGLDLIICDHHHPGRILPSATAIIDPKQEGDTYPEKNLAGVGLAYKLASALAQALKRNDINVDNYLDLVALGTVADLAPLIDENRSLVRQGLEKIRTPKRQGLLSLMGVSGVDYRTISASDIGYILGPRLNAAGRLDTALDAYTLLTTKDLKTAGMIAQSLDNQNRKRQKLTKEIQNKAEELVISDDPDALLLFAAHEEFHPGVVGLAASRMADRYYRPAIVAHKDIEFTRGSCRSIPEFHITEALDQCAELLERHGGHASAAGFTVKNENLEQLKERLLSLATEALSEKDLQPTLNADAEVQLSDLRQELLLDLRQIEPTGYGNPQPLFVSRELKPINYRAVGRDGSHLKLKVTDGWLTYDAIAFQQGEWYSKMTNRIDILYSFELNEYRGQRSFQLNIRDLRPTTLSRS